MNREADVASVAGLIANEARACMLDALFDGAWHAAGRLAQTAGISASTASAHIDALVAGGLIVEDRRGRHRYLRLNGPHVAHALEALSTIAPRTKPRPGGSDRVSDLRRGRTCYDHLAGALGVALTDSLVRARTLRPKPDGTYSLSAVGARRLTAFGVDLEGARRRRRAYAYSCLDWSERRPHLAGALGAAIASRLFTLDWLARTEERRAVRVTATGRQGLETTFGLSEWSST